MYKHRITHRPIIDVSPTPKHINSMSLQKSMHSYFLQIYRLWHLYYTCVAGCLLLVDVFAIFLSLSDSEILDQILLPLFNANCQCRPVIHRPLQVHAGIPIRANYAGIFRSVSILANQHTRYRVGMGEARYTQMGDVGPLGRHYHSGNYGALRRYEETDGQNDNWSRLNNLFNTFSIKHN
jgi:hypothetical protein